jgi:adenylylsulfate kinase|tara:strand:+ start:403 stop:897 length:495 start_codon:yes stop_codon:yes gene_type:complete
MKILICGLPGSGKTWLSEKLLKNLKNCAWYNADFVRKFANDWDFEVEGRMRQALRMKTFADFEKSQGRWVICDFVAPSQKARDSFNADYVIWMDTILEGRVVSAKLAELNKVKNLPFDANTLSSSKKFEDTNKMFEKPTKVDLHITRFLNDEEIEKIAKQIKNY